MPFSRKVGFRRVSSDSSREDGAGWFACPGFGLGAFSAASRRLVCHAGGCAHGFRGGRGSPGALAAPRQKRRPPGIAHSPGLPTTFFLASSPHSGVHRDSPFTLQFAFLCNHLGVFSFSLPLFSSFFICTNSEDQRLTGVGPILPSSWVGDRRCHKNPSLRERDT